MKMKVLQIGNFLFPFDFALRVLKAKYKEDLDDMFIDLPVLNNDFIREIWKDVTPITFSELSDFKSLFPNLRAEQASAKRQALFRFLPFSTIFADAEIVDERTVETKQKDSTITNHYILRRRPIKEVFPEMREPAINGKKVTHVYAVQVFDVHFGTPYFLMVPHTEKFCKKGSYDAAAAVAWAFRTRIPLEHIKCIRRQGEVIITTIKPEYVGKPWLDSPYHMNKEDFFKLIVEQS
jgi:hypothetical protein